MIEILIELARIVIGFGLMFVSIFLFALGTHILFVPKHIWDKARKSGNESDLREVMQYRRIK